MQLFFLLCPVESLIGPYLANKFWDRADARCGLGRTRFWFLLNSPRGCPVLPLEIHRTGVQAACHCDGVVARWCVDTKTPHAVEALLCPHRCEHAEDAPIAVSTPRMPPSPRRSRRRSPAARASALRRTGVSARTDSGRGWLWQASTRPEAVPGSPNTLRLPLSSTATAVPSR